MDSQTNLENILNDLRIFLQKTSRELEERLVTYPWQQYVIILKNQSMQFKIRQASIAVLKFLVYKQNFVNDPNGLFKQVVQFYLRKNILVETEKENNEKWQQIEKLKRTSEIVLQQIMSIYFSKNDKYEFSFEFLCKSLNDDNQTVIRKLRLLKVAIQTMQPESINNEMIVGELIFYWKDLLVKQIKDNNKIQIITQLIMVIKVIINCVSEIDEDQNIPQTILRTSQYGKQLIQHIILLESNHQQIITKNKKLNIAKVQALQLFSSTWLYYLQETLFYAFLNSLITCYKPLYDEESLIMEKVVNLLDRSIQQPSYQEVLHKNANVIVLSLCKVLQSTQSQQQLGDVDPSQFVAIVDDFCKKQEKQMLMMRAGSLLSNLCQTVDGYLSFVGYLCLTIIKKVQAEISPQFQKLEEFLKNIEQSWPSPFIAKLGVCLIIMAALSDQVQKRKDLYGNLYSTLVNMAKKRTLEKYFLSDPNTIVNNVPINGNENTLLKNSLQNSAQNDNFKLPPHIICKFMNLYSFYAFPGCLDIFLKLKNDKQVYGYQLQQCYQTLDFYFRNKGPQYEKYVQYVGRIVIISDRLTMLLQKTIVENDQMRSLLQIQILEKLVLWFLQAYEIGNMTNINKYSNLLVILISKLKIGKDEVVDLTEGRKKRGKNEVQMQIQNEAQKDEQYHILQQQMQKTIFQYLNPLFKLISVSNSEEQSIIQISIQHIKKFKCIQHNKQRLIFFLEMSFTVIKRNNYVLNSCLESLGFLIQYLPYDLLCQLISECENMLVKQQRPQDLWQCLYLLQICLVRIFQLKQPCPSLSCIDFIAKGLAQSQYQTLSIKILMVLMAIIYINPQYNMQLCNFIRNQPLPDLVHPYQNKPYCLYLIGLMRMKDNSLEYSRKLFALICKTAQKQKRIKKAIKAYEQEIYQFSQSADETAINSFMKSRIIIHPLIRPQHDIYQSFKDLWQWYPQKNELKIILTQSQKKAIKDLWNIKMIHSTLRKCLKVKRITLQ